MLPLPLAASMIVQGHGVQLLNLAAASAQYVPLHLCVSVDGYIGVCVAARSGTRSFTSGFDYSDRVACAGRCECGCRRL